MFKLDGDLMFKIGSTYRRLVQLPRLEMCKYLSFQGKENFLFDSIMKGLKDGGSNVVHSCPYKVKS